MKGTKTLPFPLETSLICAHLVCNYCHLHLHARKTLARAWVSAARFHLFVQGQPQIFLLRQASLFIRVARSWLVSESWENNQMLTRICNNSVLFWLQKHHFCKTCSTSAWSFHQPRFVWVEVFLWHTPSRMKVKWCLPYKLPWILGMMCNLVPEPISSLKPRWWKPGNCLCSVTHGSYSESTMPDSCGEPFSRKTCFKGMSSTAKLWSWESQTVFS